MDEICPVCLLVKRGSTGTLNSLALGGDNSSSGLLECFCFPIAPPATIERAMSNCSSKSSYSATNSSASNYDEAASNSRKPPPQRAKRVPSLQYAEKSSTSLQNFNNNPIASNSMSMSMSNNNSWPSFSLTPAAPANSNNNNNNNNEEDPSSQISKIPHSFLPCSETELESHLIRLALVFFVNHCFIHPLELLKTPPKCKYPKLRKACLYYGVLLTSSPFFFGEQAIPNRSLRKQVANSIYPLDCKWEEPDIREVDAMYDCISAKLLQSMTQFFMGSFDTGCLLLSQAVHGARVMGFLDLPKELPLSSLLQERKDEGDLLVIKLSIVYRILVLDTYVAAFCGTDFHMDDSLYFPNLNTFDNLMLRKSSDMPPTHTYSHVDIEHLSNEFAQFYNGNFKLAMKGSIIYIKFLRSVLAWVKTTDNSARMEELVTFHGQVLRVMLINCDDDFKRLDVSQNGIDVILSAPCRVTASNAQNLMSLMMLVFLHSQNVGDQYTLFPTELSGLPTATSGAIIVACIHALGRIGLFFQTNAGDNAFNEPFSSHLPPRPMSSGFAAVITFLTCSQALQAFSSPDAMLLFHLMASSVGIIRDYVVPMLKKIGEVWEAADILVHRLSAEQESFFKNPSRRT